MPTPSRAASVQYAAQASSTLVITIATAASHLSPPSESACQHLPPGNTGSRHSVPSPDRTVPRFTCRWSHRLATYGCQNRAHHSACSTSALSSNGFVPHPLQSLHVIRTARPEIRVYIFQHAIASWICRRNRSSLRFLPTLTFRGNAVKRGCKVRFKIAFCAKIMHSSKLYQGKSILQGSTDFPQM